LGLIILAIGIKKAIVKRFCANIYYLNERNYKGKYRLRDIETTNSGEKPIKDNLIQEIKKG